MKELIFKYTVDGGAELTVGAGPRRVPPRWSGTSSGPGQGRGGVLVLWRLNTEGVDAIYPAGSPNFAASYTVGQAPVGGDGPAKLLLTEISTLGTEQEFIEIHNPGAEAVDLSDYYLTDANYTHRQSALLPDRRRQPERCHHRWRRLQ